MSRKKNWLCLIKRFFSEPHHHHHQKRSKRRRWLSGRLRRAKGLPPPSPSPSPPPPRSPPVQMTEVDAEEKQTNGELPKFSECTTAENDVVLVNHQYDKNFQSLAAIKIQTAFRGSLARKALRALKGFVRLQAIIRGRAVRRQAMTTLKCLQAIVNIQSEICTMRSQIAHAKYPHLQLRSLHAQNFTAEFTISPTTLRMERDRHRRLDDGLLHKEEEIDILLRKKEAILRRQKNKAYSFNHRSSTESEEDKAEGRLRYWLEQCVNDQVLPNRDSKPGLKHLKLKNTEHLNRLSLHRRSFHSQTHRKQGSREDNDLNPRSPGGIPAYMAATESAKAKARSSSTPRLRPVLVDHGCLDGDSPNKHKLVSPMSSTRSDVTCSGISRISNRSSCCSSSQHKSPGSKRVPDPVRSNRKMNNVSLDCESLVVSRGSR